MKEKVKPDNKAEAKNSEHPDKATNNCGCGCFPWDSKRRKENKS